MKMQSENQTKQDVKTGTGAGILQLAEPEYGALDTEKLARLQALLADEAEKPAPPYLVLDLSRIHYFGASFIGIVVTTWDRLRKRKRRLVVCGLTPYCGKLIRTLHLDRIFDIYSTQSMALQAIGQRMQGGKAAESRGIRVQKSEVAWDPLMVRLEYIGEDNVPFHTIIAPRTDAR